MKPNDKVKCIDDGGWIIQEARPFTPCVGGVYTVREYTREFGVGAVSLMEGSEYDFYRACRFQKHFGETVWTGAQIRDQAIGDQ